MTTLIDLLSERLAPIQTSLLQYLDPRDIVTLTLTCKDLGGLWRTLMASAWNINHQLRHFFTDPKGFRSVQGESGALLSDTTDRDLLNFIVRGDNHQINYLHLWMHDSQTRLMVDYLESDGYVHRPALELYPEDPSICDGQLHFWKEGHDHMTRIVCISHSEHSPIQYLLSQAMASTEVQFLSWNKAYSVFPFETLIKQEIILLHKADVCLELCFDELMAPESSRVPGELCYKVMSPGPPTTVRKVGDKHTFRFNLDIEGVKVPNIPDSVLESSMFTVQRLQEPFVSQSGHGTHPRHSIETKEFRHPILKRTYAVPSIALSFDGPKEVKYLPLMERIEDLSYRLNRLTLEELKKVPEVERPHNYAQLGCRWCLYPELQYSFSLPVDWTFYDDEVVEELETIWERRHDMWLRTQKMTTTTV